MAKAKVSVVSRKAKTMAAAIQKKVLPPVAGVTLAAGIPGSTFTQWLLDQVESFLKEHGKEMAIELVSALIDMAPGGPIVTKLLKSILKILSLGA